MGGLWYIGILSLCTDDLGRRVGGGGEGSGGVVVVVVDEAHVFP